MKGWRTILVNAALLCVALTDYLIADGQLVGLVVSNPKTAGLVVAGVNLANIALRFVTTGPVGKK